jgi:hypothetical protein
VKQKFMSIDAAGKLLELLKLIVAIVACRRLSIVFYRIRRAVSMVFNEQAKVLPAHAQYFILTLLYIKVERERPWDIPSSCFW